jgi:hypothetical protein
MRYLVLSDIHANFLALEAVIEESKKLRFDEVFFWAISSAIIHGCGRHGTCGISGKQKRPS